MTRPGIDPRSPISLANTLLINRLIGLVGRVFTNGPGDLVQSQVASYETLLKWYLITPSLTLSNIRYVSRVKWSNPGKGVAPSPTPQLFMKILWYVHILK